MRAIFMVLSAVVLILNMAKAQRIEPEKENRFGFGVFAGLNHSVPIIRTRFPDHFESYTTTLLGIVLRYRLNRQSYLHIQPSWSRLDNAKFSGGYTSFRTSISTMKLPVTYRHYVFPSRKSVFIEAGVGFNQIVEGSYRHQIIVYCINGPCLQDLYRPDASIQNKSALSGLAGVGVNIQIQRNTIPVTLRYERYLSNHTFPGDDYNPPTPVKFENFALTTGVNL